MEFAFKHRRVAIDDSCTGKPCAGVIVSPMLDVYVHPGEFAS